jgi:hypothetical protein
MPLRNRVRSYKLLLITLRSRSLGNVEYLMSTVIHEHRALKWISYYFLEIVLGDRSLILKMDRLVESILVLYFRNIWCSNDILFVSNNFRILRIWLISQLSHHLVILKPSEILSLMNLVYLCHIRYSL